MAGARMAAEPGIPWPEIAGGLLSGSLLTQAVAWWNGRKKRDGERNAYVMGAVDHAVTVALDSVTTRLETVESQHIKCEADLKGATGRIDEMQKEINRLMQGPISSYGDIE